MLTGRESLIRVIGKRRRFLPNRQSLLSNPTKDSVNLFKKEANIVGAASSANGEGSSDHAGSSNGVKMPAPEWVTCPVCGKKVCGENNLINSHLDACLARGTKRKLSQRTLLQLNFCPTTKVKIHCIDSDCPGTDSIQSDVNINDPCGIVHKRSNLDVDVLEENDTSPSKSHLKSEVVSQIQESGTRENQVANGRINLHSSHSENEKPICEMDESVDDIYGLVLETFIVGRRFGDEVELIRGASIFLLRDPDNVKDPNAVKVLSADFGSTKMIGFLPRELAQYLSPLMAKFHLTFEGHITSVPKHALAVVPIQIVCQNKKSYGQIECSDDQTFKSLWKCAQLVVKSAKTHPPSMTKYQQNLAVLIQEVLRSGAHLFTQDEKRYLETFTTLSDDSQRLFARIYTRKGPWFRMSTFSYPEISDCELAIMGLSAAGYISSIKSMNDLQDDDLKQVLNLLTVYELHEILCTINKECNRGKRKQDLVALILSVYGGGLCPLLLSLILKKSGACIRLSAMAEFLIWRAERLFFLNGEQDLSAFLIVDLGIVKYPHYNCIMSDQIFPDRADLLSYEEAIEVAQIMDESLEEDNSDVVLRCVEIAHSHMSCSQMRRTHSESVTTFLSRFSASWVYSKVVLLGVSFLERERRYIDAISLLSNLLDNFSSDGRRGYWILRLSVDLEHLGRLDESLTVAEDGLSDPWVRAGSRVALQRRVLRLAKPPRRWKVPSFSKFIKQKITEVHVQGRPLNCETGMKNRFYGEDGEQCGVEELALQYYAGEGGGWQGVHTESGIWLTIYGLLMWDIIFADVPNVFRTRFQTAPLDMETDSFYEVRKNLIEPLLQKILDGMAEEILITSWESHEGTSCRGVNWVKHSLSELRAAVTCIGASCLASICRHLAQDYQHWSSGMPDLLLWRFHGDYRGEAKLVEVKGPRDRLSEQQRAWLLFLMDCGFNVEVCKVSPPESA